MSVPGFVRFLRLVAQRAVVGEVQVAGLHVVPDVALHGAGVVTLQAAEAVPLAQRYDLGHDQSFVCLHRTPLLSWHNDVVNTENPYRMYSKKEENCQMSLQLTLWIFMLLFYFM